MRFKRCVLSLIFIPIGGLLESEAVRILYGDEEKSAQLRNGIIFGQEEEVEARMCLGEALRRLPPVPLDLACNC